MSIHLFIQMAVTGTTASSLPDCCWWTLGFARRMKTDASVVQRQEVH